MRYLAIAMLCVGLFSTPAFAKHHHRHHYRHHYVHHHRNHPVVEALGAGLAQILKDMHRPRDCYGIAWCGCWLRHQLGMGRDYNLARNWAHYGHATTAHIGAVVVWRHHVGIISGGSPGNWIVTSGNDGHAVRSRRRSLAGAIAFRA